MPHLTSRTISPDSHVDTSISIRCLSSTGNTPVSISTDSSFVSCRSSQTPLSVSPRPLGLKPDLAGIRGEEPIQPINSEREQTLEQRLDPVKGHFPDLAGIRGEKSDQPSISGGTCVLTGIGSETVDQLIDLNIDINPDLTGIRGEENQSSLNSSGTQTDSPFDVNKAFVASPEGSDSLDSVRDLALDLSAFVSGLDSESWEADPVFNRLENLSTYNQTYNMPSVGNQTFTVQYHRDLTSGRLVSTTSPITAAQAAAQTTTQTRPSVSTDQNPVPTIPFGGLIPMIDPDDARLNSTVLNFSKLHLSESQKEVLNTL